MAQRFYRHEIGFTADQRRTEKRLKQGIGAAITSIVSACLAIVAAISWSYLAVPASLVSAGAIGIGLLISIAVAAATVAAVIAGVQHRENSSRSGDQSLTTWLWICVPVAVCLVLGILTLLSSNLVAIGAVCVLCCGAAIGAATVIRELAATGRHTNPRICVIDLKTRQRMWLTESELAALDEAAAAAETALTPLPRQSPEQEYPRD